MDIWLQRAIRLMEERSSEPLTLDRLAREAAMSKFHFLRTFSAATGVTPCRFLSAVRIRAAKGLLLSTERTVCDISAAVGYSSTGSFTGRFTDAVGCSPARYRQIGRRPRVGADQLLADRGAGGGAQVSGVVAGSAPSSAIYVGAFAGSILAGKPVAQVVIGTPGPFQLTDVPSGDWYIHAVAHPDPPDGRAWGERRLVVDATNVVRVEVRNPVEVRLTLRHPQWSDPPVLLALPELDPMAAFAA